MTWSPPVFRLPSALIQILLGRLSCKQSIQRAANRTACLEELLANNLRFPIISEVDDFGQTRTPLSQSVAPQRLSALDEPKSSQYQTCAWRIRAHAAIGVWYNPRQCVCQR